MENKVYDIITDKILKLLETGTAPWSKPWKPGDVPRNLSGRAYSGLNVFLLESVRQERGYTSNIWMTYNQAQAVGAQVRKGEHGTEVIFWKLLTKDKEDPKADVFPLLRYFTVFNACQVDNYTIPSNDLPEYDPIDKAESIFQNMPHKPVIKGGGNEAFYASGSDYIQLPAHGQFKALEYFYSVAFHEMAHSTGHNSRLARFTEGYNHSFGSQDYSKEELIAEMTATFLCAESGIENHTINNSAAYIQSWIKALKDDKKMIVQAASAAQKAANYILDKLAIEESPVIPLKPGTSNRTRTSTTRTGYTRAHSH